MPNGKEFVSPTKELQDEFERQLKAAQARAEQEYYKLPAEQRIKTSLPLQQLRVKQSLVENFQRIAGAEELRLQLEAGEVPEEFVGVAKSNLYWKQHEADLIREEIELEKAIYLRQNMMNKIGAPTVITSIAAFFYLRLGRPGHVIDPRASLLYGKALIQSNFYVTRLQEISKEKSIAITYQTMYEALPAFIQMGKVTSYDDLFEMKTEEGESITWFSKIGKDDPDLKRIFNEVYSATLGLPEGTKAEEINYTEAIALLAKEPRYTGPITLQKATIENILKMLSATSPEPTLPTGLSTPEDAIKMYEEAGVPPEVLTELEGVEAYTRQIELLWSTLSSNQDAVQQGLEEAKLPEMGIDDILLQTVAQPALSALDLAGKMYHEWTAPWGAWLYRMRAEAWEAWKPQYLTKSEKEFLAVYREARNTTDWWHAGGEAFENVELGLCDHLIFEWVADPLTWVGTGVPKYITTSIPKIGKYVGPVVGKFEAGWLKAWDVLIFDKIKSAGKLIPKTPMMASKSYAGKDMIAAFRYLQSATMGRLPAKIPLTQAQKLLIEARDLVLKRPGAVGAKADAGRALLRTTLIDEDAVKTIAKNLGSEVEVSKEMLLNVSSIVNGQIDKSGAGMLSKKEAVPFLLRTLGIDDTKPAIRKATAEVNKLLRVSLSTSDELLGKAKVTPEILTNIFNHSQEAYLDTALHAAAHNLEMSGRIAQQFSRVEYAIMNTWRNTMDRWVVTPGARMYLVFSAYGPGNILEGYIKQLSARQVPLNPITAFRKNKLITVVNPAARAQRLMGGLNIPLEIMTGTPRIEMAGEVPSFLGIEKTSKNLAKWRNVLSGGPIGKFFIDWPSRIGLYQRSDYLRKMFMTLLPEEEAGQVVSALARKIDDASKAVGDDLLKALNLSRYELKEELLERAISGPANTRSMLDDIIADRIKMDPGISKDIAFSDKISGGRVAEAVGKYTNIPEPFQDVLIQSASDGSLWKNKGFGINEATDNIKSGMYDYFVHTPEFYKTKLQERVDGILGMEARTKDEFLGMMQELQELQRFYGSSTDDVIRAMNELESEMSKRMKWFDFNEWRAKYTVEPGGVYEGLADYTKQMRESLDKLDDKLRLTMTKPESIIDWSKVRFSPGIPDNVKAKFTKIVEDLPVSIKSDLREVWLNPNQTLAAGYYPKLGRLSAKNWDALTDAEVIYHELAHSIPNTDIVANYASVKDFPIGAGQIPEDVFEEFATDFSNYTRGMTSTNFMDTKTKVFFEEYFPKTQRKLPFTPAEQSSINNWLSAWTDEQRYLADWWAKRRTTEAAEILRIKALSGEQKSTAWSTFKADQMKAHYERITTQSQMKLRLIDQSNTLSEFLGMAGPPPPIIDATGRKLSKVDVATLFHSNPAQMPQAVMNMETMTLKSKQEFVTEVKAQAERMARGVKKSAAQLGWTDEAIGEVYDYTLRDMRMNPELASVMEPHLMELKSLQDELWSIYRTKGLPEGIADNFQRFITTLADELEATPGYVTKRIVSERVMPTKKLYTADELADLVGAVTWEAHPQVEGFWIITDNSGGKWTVESVGKKWQFTSKPIELSESDVWKNIIPMMSKRRVIGQWDEPIAYIDKEWKDLPSGLKVRLKREFSSEFGTKVPTKMPFIETTVGAEPLTESLEREYNALLKAAKKVQPDSPVVQQFNEVMKQVKTAPNKRIALRQAKALEDEIRVIAGVIKPTKAKAEYEVVGLSDSFQKSKQSAADKASKEYYKDWADYTNENASTAIMRSIYPFWTYELHRLFWLPRASIRMPGIFKAWGTYMDNTEDGYVHIPGTSLEFNPLRGTIFMGGMTRLIKRDYPEYYDMFPQVSEFFDWYSRFGFYPAAWMNLLKLTGGTSAGGGLQLGELLPAWIKTPLNAYIAAFPDSKPAKVLLDKILPEPYRNYGTIQLANAICQREQKLFNGMDIWDKMQQGQDLTTEEKDVWTRAIQGYGWRGVLMEQSGILRIRTEEQLEAWEASAKLIEEMTGYTEKDQLWIRRHGFRIGDYAMLDPLQQDVLSELDAVKYHSGVFSTLMPTAWQEEDKIRREFFRAIRDYADQVKAEQEDLDRRVKLPTGSEGWISMEQWNRSRSDLRAKYANFFNDLSETERYKGVALDMDDVTRPDGTIREGLITRAEKRQQLPPIQHPAEELLNYYYSIQLEKVVDPNSGALIDDWDGYFLKIDAIVNTLKGVQREDFVAIITKNMTDLEKLRWEISHRYFRGYNRRQEAILSTQFDTDQQALIKRWIFGSPTERDEIQQVLLPNGRKLISYYQELVRQTGENLRRLSPELDAWLLFFEITSTTLSTQAQQLYSQYRRDYGIRE